MFDVNVLGVAICTKHVIQDMISRNTAGVVINIGSLSGHRVPPTAKPGTNGMYCASKHAVRAMTEALRQELRSLDSRIRVCQISPVNYLLHLAILP